MLYITHGTPVSALLISFGKPPGISFPGVYCSFSYVQLPGMKIVPFVSIARAFLFTTVKRYSSINESFESR